MTLLPTTANPKTVFILGAGFSAPAGGPSQANLIQEIYALAPTPDIAVAREHLSTLLTSTFNIPTAKLPSVQLEDIFTPIDRCLADGLALKGVTQAVLQTVRLDLEYLISKAIDQAFVTRGVSSSDYVRSFASRLVGEAKKRSALAKDPATSMIAMDYDPFSIISLN
jgi:hypothetical protein